MIYDKEYYYIPISLHAAWKVTKNEESDAVNKEEIEYKVRQRLYRLKSRRQLKDERRLDNIMTRRKIADQVLVEKLIEETAQKVDPINAQEKDDNWVQEERNNIVRVAAELSVGDRVSPLVLPENG